MTTAESTTQSRRCNCCGRTFPRREVAELCETPGVFMCTGCGLWAARRATTFGVLRRLSAETLQGLAHRLRPHRRHRLGPEAARAAIPVLASSDLGRTAAFWARFGFEETERHPRISCSTAATRSCTSRSPMSRSRRAPVSSMSATPSSCGNASPMTSPASDRSRTPITGCGSSSRPIRTATGSGSAVPFTDHGRPVAEGQATGSSAGAGISRMRVMASPVTCTTSAVHVPTGAFSPGSVGMCPRRASISPATVV